jgi:hypothetical protein
MRRKTMMAALIPGLVLILCISCGQPRKVTEATTGTEAAAERRSDTGTTTGPVAAKAEITNTKPDIQAESRRHSGTGTGGHFS